LVRVDMLVPALLPAGPSPLVNDPLSDASGSM
jgi:hypothetical protein